MTNWQHKIFCEEIKTNKNPKEIFDYFKQNIEPKYPPVWQKMFNNYTKMPEKMTIEEAKRYNKLSPGYMNFGGWTIIGENDDYASSFQNGTIIRKNEFVKERDMKNKTNICVGPINDLIDYISSLGFYITRCRLSVIPEQSKLSWHTDTPFKNEKILRLHFPLKTNEKVHFITEHDRFYMPANGSFYVVNVNHHHTVHNDGNSDRYHIIMNIFDKNNVLEKFKDV